VHAVRDRTDRGLAGRVLARRRTRPLKRRSTAPLR